MRISINPPPPIFPAGGCTTANTNPVATAASTALPPACMISTPAREASSCTLTTIPCCACTGSVEAKPGPAAQVAAAISSKINDLCRNCIQSDRAQERRPLEASRRRQQESNDRRLVFPDQAPQQNHTGP